MSSGKLNIPAWAKNDQTLVYLIVNKGLSFADAFEVVERMAIQDY
jgi:hypothetical protein